MGRIPTTVGLMRGDGLVARFGSVVIYLAGASPSTERILGAAETAATAADPGVAIAQRLAATVFSSGSAQPPAFGVVAPTAGGILVLLRGSVRAVVDGPEGARQLSGVRAMTWVDEILRDPVRKLSVAAETDPGTVIPHTDLRSGVVAAGGFLMHAPPTGSTPHARTTAATPKPPPPETHPAVPTRDPTRRAPIPTPSHTRFSTPGNPEQPQRDSAATPGDSEPGRRPPGRSEGSPHPPGESEGRPRTPDELQSRPRTPGELQSRPRTSGSSEDRPRTPGSSEPVRPASGDSEPMRRQAATTPAVPPPEETQAVSAVHAEHDRAAGSGPIRTGPASDRTPDQEAAGGPNLAKAVQREASAVSSPSAETYLDAADLPPTAAYDAKSAAAEEDSAPKVKPFAGRAEPETDKLGGRLGALTSTDGAVYPLDRPYVIGRDPMIDESIRRAAAAPIVIPRDRHVSRVHAHVFIDKGTVLVRDAATPGGTFMAAPGAPDWIRVGQRPVELKPGWSLRVGERILTYRPNQARR
ncbi:FHA domain-containing protein [Nocardia sp. SYP-A9097]|uniref:FHA domain-containing protein n=1 Tax=Nocardia sp. SYP-A9097 TaxID=2663237 RepID=UPI00129A3F91|nr:FHA domain-containing protein [Nocardia sp. SYP-A9097]MRH89175.1 FHA domain-containing protein [Nocardia sp. SYP-A9097]